MLLKLLSLYVRCRISQVHLNTQGEKTLMGLVKLDLVLWTGLWL